MIITVCVACNHSIQLQRTLGIFVLHNKSQAKIEIFVQKAILGDTVCAGACRRLRELQTREQQLARWREQINVHCGETMRLPPQQLAAVRQEIFHLITARFEQRFRCVPGVRKTWGTRHELGEKRVRCGNRKQAQNCRGIV